MFLLLIFCLNKLKRIQLLRLDLFSLLENKEICVSRRFQFREYLKINENRLRFRKFEIPSKLKSADFFDSAVVRRQPGS